MKVYASFTYIYEPELGYNRARVDFWSCEPVNGVEVPVSCKMPFYEGVVLYYNEETGEYDAEISTLDEITSREVNYEHFLPWSTIYNLYRKFVNQQHLRCTDGELE